MSKKKIKKISPLIHDIIMITIGIVIAIFLSKTGIIDAAVSAIRDYYILASFIAGIFFTSAFTLAPSSIALVHIAETAPIPSVALWGGIGAMCGDLILFFFIKDRFAADLMNAMKPSFKKQILKSFHLGFLKWLSPIIGALIIASPLPDEFGVTLLGMSKVRTSMLIPISLVMNIIGIYLLIDFAFLL